MIKYITIGKLMTIYKNFIIVTSLISINYFINIYFRYNINNFYTITDTFENEKCLIQLNCMRDALYTSQLIIYYSFCFLFVMFIFHHFIVRHCGKYYEILILVAFCLSSIYKIIYDTNTNNKFYYEVDEICPTSVSNFINLVMTSYIIFESTGIIISFCCILPLFCVIIVNLHHGMYIIYDKIKMYTIPYYEYTPEINDDKDNYKNV